MLKIRKEQMEVLKGPLIHPLILDLMDYVRQYFPEENTQKPDKELYDRLARTVCKAEKYGIRIEKDLYKFVNIAMLFNPDFDEQEETAWTVAFLTDRAVSSPTQRLNRLYEEVIYRLEVEENNTLIEKEFCGDKQSLEADESYESETANGND